ncbi:hypothetical protein OJAV_G00069520 [Oryzias javanicus]|uniref:CHHC U11-48K-type domain-containing protein n=1 Tax=Oryzias javanicus TaxID=123683 RepID=A0A3S2MNX6_ORYJA|nr:hypothetical protein OJAV_G00069520 [Oryzias javanicus]
MSKPRGTTKEACLWHSLLNILRVDKYHLEKGVWQDKDRHSTANICNKWRPGSSFGSSTSPCRTAFGLEKQVLEEKGETGNCDPDKILQCPYDKNHQIRNSRFPYHILKCKKNHPKLAEELKACPFNARHLIPKQELARHIKMCEDRKGSEESESKDEAYAWHVPVPKRENPCKTEDWDMEADDHVAPFVWGVKPKMDKQPINNLPLGFRAPNALPWESFKQ